jgi:hypothetical protein
MQTIGGATTNHPPPVHVDCGVTRVDSSNVRAERHGIAVRIHLLVGEIVVAHRIIG